MQTRFLKYILLTILIALSFTVKAKDKDEDHTFFEEKTILKKGVTLSELGLLGNKKVKIRYSKAMRYDANYRPADALGGTKPFNLPIDSIQKHVRRAHDALKSVKDNQAFTTLLEGKNIELPIGIKRTVGNKEVTICLDSLVFTPTYAYGVLYVIIEDTKNNKTLAFLGRDIRFTKDGGFTGDARLELLQTYDMAYGPNINVSFLVDATHENYVVFNCEGFKHLHVDARVLFSRNIFIPESPSGDVARSPAQVSADFRTDFESLDNWMVQISNVPKFQVVGLEGLSFQLNKLAFDYSSTQNPTGIAFPAGYSHSALTSGNANLWEGFYVEGLSITLPEQIKLKSNSTKRIVLTVEKALIDKLGFTGRASVTNLLPLAEGDMSGWSYSIDYLAVDVVKSVPVGASFIGQLVVPITKETEKFGYAANFLPGGNFNFKISTTSTISFPLWGAGSVSIYPDSYIQVGTVSKKFVPKASLTGKLSITTTVNGDKGDENTSDKNSNLALAELTFTKLIIQTDGPLISLDPNGGAVSFGSPAMQQKCTNLPVTIENLGIRTEGNKLGFSFTLKINITGEKDAGGGFGGTAGIIVWGERGTGLKWKYSNTELNKIGVKANIAIIGIDAMLEFFRNDPIYGSGFAASLDLTINLSATKIVVKSRGIFGKKDVPSKPSEIYRYFALDALLELPTVITLYPPVLFLNAFGGGASYKMGVDTKMPVANAKFVSLSGVAYTPDYNKGLGLKAIVGIQGATRQIYEGQLIFEVMFNSSGGLSMIGFSGYVQVASVGTGSKMAKMASSVSGMVAKAKTAEAALGAVGVKSILETSKAKDEEVYGEITKMAEGGAIMAQWRMTYDLDNSTFICINDIFIDVYGIVKGIHAYGHAGRVDILFSPKEWHIFVGRPDYALGTSMMGFLDMSGYFMMGQNLPPPRPMPNGQKNVFPNVPIDGMGLGARIGTPDVKMDVGWLWFRAGFKAGFDVLLYNVKGQSCNGKAKGIKGWYLIGQVYILGYVNTGLRTKINYPYPCCGGWDCCCTGRKWWRRCWCPCCGTCWGSYTIDISMPDFSIDVYGLVKAANPTYVEGHVKICNFEVKVKSGSNSCN